MNNFNQLISNEILYLKMQKDSNPSQIQRLQQMSDGDIGINEYRSTGVIIPSGEFLKRYPNVEIGETTEQIIHYAGGNYIEITKDGGFCAVVDGSTAYGFDLKTIENFLFSKLKD